MAGLFIAVVVFYVNGEVIDTVYPGMRTTEAECRHDLAAVTKTHHSDTDGPPGLEVVAKCVNFGDASDVDRFFPGTQTTRK